MEALDRLRNWTFATSRKAVSAAFTLAIYLSVIFACRSIDAQTFSVIHSFAGGSDGASPSAGLIIDQGGNLYGTTLSGGAGFGTVFRLKRGGSSWVLSLLYKFAGGSDGAGPYGRLVLASDGTLYGTTMAGGMSGPSCQLQFKGCGTIFNLRPPARRPATPLDPWSETVVYRFAGGIDGSEPRGELVFDQAGNLYGSTNQGGNPACTFGCGTIYELIPSKGSWTENVIYRFSAKNDGATPAEGVIFDSVGNLYGTTTRAGSNGFGTTFQLAPSQSGWVENTLYAFQYGSAGAVPMAGLTIDISGVLYGATSYGGSSNGGTAFQLSHAGESWTFSTITSFAGTGGESGPYGGFIADPAGNLYGTTVSDGAFGFGSVFKLTRSNGGWSYTSLHDFTGGNDGATPISSLVFDANGNLYGTASSGGVGNGVVFEIAP